MQQINKKSKGEAVLPTPFIDRNANFQTTITRLLLLSDTEYNKANTKNQVKIS